MPEEFQITNGTVHYEHKKPIADYDNKAPFVTLSFTISEGSDPGLVTAKVMGIAMEIVERAIATNVKVVQEVEQRHAVGSDPTPAALEAQAQEQRGRPPNKPLVEVVKPDPAALDTVETDVALDELEGILTLKGDVQPMAQKVSAYLRKKDGNINKLKEVIRDSGGTSLLTIPQGNWPDFIERAKKLLP